LLIIPFSILLVFYSIEAKERIKCHFDEERGETISWTKWEIFYDRDANFIPSGFPERDPEADLA